jgi:phosphoglycerol transferase MdoB-like AlkP superfamily enzyme
MRSHPAVQLHGLPEILTANGYSFLWIHNSDATVYLGGRFYRMHGIRTIDGRDFPANAVSTSWGFSDRELMTRALDALDHLHEPFASMVLTITNHHPFQLPADAPARQTTWSARLGQMAGHHTAAMLQTVHYSDFAIGEFFAKARSRPWFANTIFVICGDHGSAVPPAGRPMTKHVFYELRHRIPLIFYSPRLPQHGVVVHGPASQADILPTVLGLAGIPTPLAGSGRDLFDVPHADPDRPIVSMNFDAHVLTVNRGRYSYHAVVPEGTTRLTAELLVDREGDPNGQANLIERESGVATACRRAASIYLRTYGWIIANDRLTLPRTPHGSG